MDRLKELQLLFLEDNEEFATNTAKLLNLYFKKIFICKSVKEALLTYKENRIDVILSDIKVDDKNGLEFIQEVRKSDDECIIAVLSAYKDEKYLLKAIPLNLISYELKPIRYDDLITLLKKISSKLPPLENVPLREELIYSFSKKELLLNGKPIRLTKKEALFIELLIKENAKPISSERVQRDIWESRVMSDAAIKNMIFRLRKKVGLDFISTIQGVGYRLSEPISF
ncbi:MAG: response regulator transcription factor [Sulfurimonas sp.]